MSMITIYKYQVESADNFGGLFCCSFPIEMPEGAEVLSAKIQHGVLCVWAKVNTENKQMTTRKIFVIGTGYDIESVIDKDDVKFIDTIFLSDGFLVYHIFA